jgi:hypothetical protein
MSDDAASGAVRARVARHASRVRSYAPHAARTGGNAIRRTSTFGTVQTFVVGLTGIALFMLIVSKPAAFTAALKAVTTVVTDVIALGDIGHATN